MEKTFLEAIGLSSKEVDVYITLLNLGESSATEIMSRAKVSRKSVYEIIQKLLDKGLISFSIREGKKYYRSSNPERLVELMEEKKQNIQSILPSLIEQFRQKQENTIVENFMGKEGMKTVINQILKVKKEIFVIAGKGDIFEFLQYYMPQYIRKRTEAKLPAKIIYEDTRRGKRPVPPYSEARYSPSSLTSPIEIIIFGDHVALLIFSEINPLAVHIKSKEISESFMNYFNIVWNLSKE